MHKYNAKQTKTGSRIGDYSEHVSRYRAEYVLEVNIQYRDKVFGERNRDGRISMEQTYKHLLLKKAAAIPLALDDHDKCMSE